MGSLVEFECLHKRFLLRKGCPTKTENWLILFFSSDTYWSKDFSLPVSDVVSENLSLDDFLLLGLKQ